VLDVPAYTIPANGIVDYQRPYVVNPLKEGRWLKASTIKVVNRQTVHHILTGYMTEVPGPGQVANESKWGVSLGGYAVGAESFVEPANTGAFIPPGGAIGFQVHYTPYGQQVLQNFLIDICRCDGAWSISSVIDGFLPQIGHSGSLRIFTVRYDISRAS